MHRGLVSRSHFLSWSLALALLVVALLVVGDSARAQGPVGEWTTPAGDVQGTRFSALSEINTTNVGRLVQDFQFRTGVEAGHEGAPLVIGKTMYIVGPFPNRLFALDLSRQGAVRWVFNPRADPRAQDKACCDIVNRGAVYANGKVIYNVLDNTTVAVNAITGRAVWRTSLGNPATGQTMTMAPLVVGNRVFVGNSGGEMGVRGFIAALDVDSGKEVWRAWSTGPDVDVRIGPRFQPFYAKDRGANLGATTWPNETTWRRGGSTVWGWVTYDPQLNLLFHGTANPGVWNPDMRPGDNKWSASVFARDPATGEAVWVYQMTPHDAWDFDGVNENIVVDLAVSGALRQLLVRFDRNGFAYTTDRRTGQILNANPYVFVNWAKGVNLATGVPEENPDKRTREGEIVTDICPAAPGGKDQQPAAFSPRTNLFYVPTNNLCMDYEALKALYFQGAPFVGAMLTMKAGPGGHRGELMAWDAAAGRKVWGIREFFPVYSGVLATAGDVVFYGTLDRNFKAIDARTGAVLFQTRLESGIIGHPMTFMGADGKQRVAIYSGPGGAIAGLVPGRLSLDDPYAALGVVNAMNDLPQFTSAGGAVHVFKIP